VRTQDLAKSSISRQRARGLLEAESDPSKRQLLPTLPTTSEPPHLLAEYHLHLNLTSTASPPSRSLCSELRAESAPAIPNTASYLLLPAFATSTLPPLLPAYCLNCFPVHLPPLLPAYRHLLMLTLLAALLPCWQPLVSSLHCLCFLPPYYLHACTYMLTFLPLPVLILLFCFVFFSPRLHLHAYIAPCLYSYCFFFFLHACTYMLTLLPAYTPAFC
jgi:hypothetical protein